MDADENSSGYISSFFQPLEDAIRLQLFSSISGHPACSAIERDLLSLPCRLGGLGLINPLKIADSQFSTSQLITLPLKELTIKQLVCAKPPDVHSIKAQVHLDQQRTSKQLAVDIRGQLTSQLQRAVDLNSEPGTSSWLLALNIGAGVSP